MKLFNINESVSFKVTDIGRRFLKERGEEVPAVDESGWSHEQLWVLMQTFGDAFRLGLLPPFETYIGLNENHIEDES